MIVIGFLAYVAIAAAFYAWMSSQAVVLEEVELTLPQHAAEGEVIHLYPEQVAQKAA
jgi:hypothetical protein